MSAEEQQRVVRELIVIASEANTQAELVQSDTEQALNFIRQAASKLNMARDHAKWHIDRLDEMIGKLRPILEGTNSLDALRTLSTLELAREKMYSFWAMIKYQQESLDSRHEVVRLGVINEHYQESKVAFRDAMQLLLEYSKAL
jgi:hypothetical protein